MKYEILNTTPVDQDVRAALASVRNLQTHTPQTKEIRRELIDFSDGEAQAVKRAKGCLFLHGESGTGKTTILHQFMTIDMEKAEKDGRGKALYVEVPAICDERSFADEILQALGDPAAHFGNPANKMRRVGKCLTENNYTLLVLDEAQHLILTSDNKTIHTVADWLKNGLNTWNVSIVFCGKDDILMIPKVNEQIKSRAAGNYHSLRACEWGNKKSRQSYKVILMALDKLLPFETSAGLEQLELAKIIYDATGGLLRPTARLIERAGLLAVRAGLDRLTTETLNMAIAKVHGGADNDNGSNKNVEVVRSRSLNKVKKPSMKLNKELHRMLATKGGE